MRVAGAHSLVPSWATDSCSKPWTRAQPWPLPDAEAAGSGPAGPQRGKAGWWRPAPALPAPGPETGSAGYHWSWSLWDGVWALGICLATALTGRPGGSSVTLWQVNGAQHRGERQERRGAAWTPQQPQVPSTHAGPQGPNLILTHSQPSPVTSEEGTLASPPVLPSHRAHLGSGCTLRCGVMAHLFPLDHCLAQGEWVPEAPQAKWKARSEVVRKVPRVLG